MKSTAFIATLLTLLMLLLVLAAAVFFMLQGWQGLQDEVAQAEREQELLENDLAAVRSQAALRERDLSTATAELATRNGRLLQSQGTASALLVTQEALLATQQTAATSEAATATAEAALPPYVEVLSPEQRASITAESEVEIVVATGHPHGVADLSLILDTMKLAALPGNGAVYRVFTYTVPSLEAGQHVLTATVRTGSNLSRSEVITFDVLTAATPEATAAVAGTPPAAATPGAGETPSPEETPGTATPEPTP